MESTSIKQSLKKAFWDVNYTAEQLNDVLMHGRSTTGLLTRERLLLRLIETYSWYKIIEILPGNLLSELLSDTVITKIRSEHLRQRYATLSRLLRKFPVPAAR